MKLQPVDRLAELPYRLRPRRRADTPTWPLTANDLARITIKWPQIYHWAGAAGIVETWKDALTDLGVLRVVSMPQPYTGVHALECIVDGVSHIVALDLSDYHDFINRDLLALCALYFKGQYDKAGYGDERIIPAGYTVTGRDYYRYYQPYRSRYERNRQVDVVGRFGFQFQEAIRRKAVEMLGAATDISFVGQGGKVRYGRYLRECASARLCVHLPGNGPFTHRVAEFIGLGSCMISVRFTTQLHVPLEPGVHYVAVEDDLSDLVDKCRYYIAADEEREKVARAGRNFFDRYVHCDQVAGYLVSTILARLGRTGRGVARGD